MAYSRGYFQVLAFCVLALLCSSFIVSAQEGAIGRKVNPAYIEYLRKQRLKDSLAQIHGSSLSKSESVRAGNTKVSGVVGFSVEGGLHVGAAAQFINVPIPFGASGIMTMRGNGWGTSIGVFWRDPKTLSDNGWISRLGMDISYVELKGFSSLRNYRDGFGGLAQISPDKTGRDITDLYEGNIPNDQNFKTIPVANKADYLPQGATQAISFGAAYQLSYPLLNNLELLVNARGGVGFLYIDNNFSYTDVNNNRRVVHVYKAPMLLFNGGATAGFKLFKYVSLQTGPTVGVATNLFATNAVMAGWSASAGLMVGF